MAVLAERLRVEIEEKGIMLHNQTGIRKGMGTIDNVFVINYLVERQLKGKKGKMVKMFVDLKAAFDMVDREVLIGMIRKRGIRERLIERVEELVRETRSSISVGREIGEKNFWTARGLRQGCPLKHLVVQYIVSGF